MRQTLKKLPPALRAELEKRIMTGQFDSYDGLKAWLFEQGHKVSRSALWRYAQRIMNRIGLSLETINRPPAASIGTTELLEELGGNTFNIDHLQRRNSDIVQEITRRASDRNPPEPEQELVP